MKTVYWIIFVLFVLAVGLSGVYYVQNNSSDIDLNEAQDKFAVMGSKGTEEVEDVVETSKLSTALVDTSNLKIYTNSEYGFEFKYSADLTVSQIVPSPALGSGVDFWVGKPGVQWSYGLDVAPNVGNNTLEEIFTKHFVETKFAGEGKQFEGATFSDLTIEVGGYPAKVLLINNDSIDVMLVRKGYIYRFAASNSEDLNKFLDNFEFKD